MKQLVAIVAIVIFGVAAGLADAVKVQKAPGFDFSTLRTYSFAWEVQPEKYKNHPVADGAPVDPAVERAVDKVLSAKGLERVLSGKPDFLVNCTGFVLDESNVEGGHLAVAEGLVWVGEGAGRGSVDYQVAVHRIEIIDPLTDNVVWSGWDTQVARDALARRRKLEKWTRRIIREFPPD